jgi:Zn-finger domain-containing protein
LNELIAGWRSSDINERINDADFAEGLTELSDTLLENLENLKDLKEEVTEIYADTLDIAFEDLENTIDGINHMNESLENYLTMIEDIKLLILI